MNDSRFFEVPLRICDRRARARAVENITSKYSYFGISASVDSRAGEIRGSGIVQDNSTWIEFTLIARAALASRFRWQLLLYLFYESKILFLDVSACVRLNSQVTRNSQLT